MKSSLMRITGRPGGFDRRYQVLQKTASKEAALFFAQDVIAQALILDPELKNLKEDIRELYL